MLNFAGNRNRILRAEEFASKHINILSHYDDETLLDKNGRLMQIIKLKGLDFVTKDQGLLNTYKNRRNSLLKQFSSEFGLYFWEVRRKSFKYPEGEFEKGYASDINQKYKSKIKNTELFYKEHYMAVITKQPEGFINKSFNIFERLNFSMDKSAKQKYLKKRHGELVDATRKVISSLLDYKAELLGVYVRRGKKLSAPLNFISELINMDDMSVPLQISDASSLLPRKRLFFNNRAGTIEVRGAEGKKRFAAVLSIKGYDEETKDGVFDELSLLNIEFVMTQSFRPLDSQVAKGKLRDQQKDMLQSRDESISQAEEIDESFDQAASGDISLGVHHLTLACYADNQEELNKYVSTIVSRFSDIDIACVRETVGCECGFWAQLPANFGYILRPAIISSKNMAAFASFHNYSLGNLNGNHWGDAVTVFETLSGSPYYFNFHYKDVGNFIVIGAMGSGKTVLIGFLIAQSMKFGGKRVIFDKDRGLEILVRALGGAYEIIKPGIRTGFNPCQLDDSPINRKFLAKLFSKILTSEDQAITPLESDVIENAIEGIYRLDKTERQFCHIASFFGSKKSGSLRLRFDQWHSDGAYAWLFDNACDSLNLNPNILGFDLSHILSEETCKTPALMYLTHRVEEALEGTRGLLFCDEGWLMLADDYFKELINNWSRTPRKKNNIFGLATQVANDTGNSSVSKSINESAFCKIIFPNPSADRNVHINDFGLTEREYELIKTMPDDQHYFLLIHGKSTNRESVVVRPNLEGLEEIIAVISARESSLKLLDEIRHEFGDDPKAWLPIFLQKIRKNKYEKM